MTISKEVIHALVNKFGQHVQPNDNNPKVDDAIKYKDDIELVIYDILGLLRSTVVSSSICPLTGRRTRMTCREFFDRVFNMSAFASILVPSVRVVVVCIDRYGARRVEKTATTISRKRSREEGQPESIPMPPGQCRYFSDDTPMPGELIDIFESARIKAEFYEYLTHAFTSARTQGMLPVDKMLVLSGGVRIDPDTREVEPLQPLEITTNEVRRMSECDNSNISEGDLDAPHFALYVFPRMNVHIYSFDSDVLLICMLAIRELLRDNPDRKCVFVTRRSNESRAPTEREVRQRTEAEQRRVIAFDTTLAETRGDVAEAYRVAGKMYNASSSSSSADAASSLAFRSKPVWKDLYFDVPAMCTLLQKEANDRLAEHGLVMRNAVEVNVLALILSSQKHDYIQTRAISPRVGPQFVWPAFTNNLWRFSELVTMTSNERNEYYYTVNVASLRDLANAIYDEKGSTTLKQSAFPTTEALHKLAAQCVWTLQYWGNGTRPGYTVVDGTTVNEEDGLPLYGYTRDGWADKVSGDSLVETCRCCPMIDVSDGADD